MKLMHSCEEASRLMSRALDEPLGLLDRALLQVHLSMCGNCRNVEQQLRVVDELMGELYGDDTHDGIDRGPGSRR